MKAILNKESVDHIRVIPEWPVFGMRPYKKGYHWKIFGITIDKVESGWYDIFGGSFQSEPLKNEMVVGDTLFSKPYLNVVMKSGSSFTQGYYDTVELAEEAALRICEEHGIIYIPIGGNNISYSDPLNSKTK